jgi:hypothetical protein
MYRYNTQVDNEQILTHNVSLGVCFWFVGWMWACSLMRWRCIDEIVLGLRSVEELQPSPLLGVDSADTNQLPKEKDLHRQFQYFQITQPGSSTVTPLYQQRITGPDLDL